MMIKPDAQPKADPEAATRYHALVLARHLGAICSRAGMSPAAVALVEEGFSAKLHEGTRAAD